jgi:hypothetical protein
MHGSFSGTAATNFNKERKGRQQTHTFPIAMSSLLFLLALQLPHVHQRPQPLAILKQTSARAFGVVTKAADEMPTSGRQRLQRSAHQRFVLCEYSPQHRGMQFWKHG